jgi:hypothetical protein
VMLEHNFDNMVNFDINTVVYDRLEKFEAVSVMVVLIDIVFMLMLLVVVRRKQLNGLLHLEFFQKTEKEESKLNFTFHENIVLIGFLTARINHLVCHCIGLILKHNLGFMLQMTLSTDCIGEVDSRNLRALRCGQVYVSNILA